jgi:hypothetical protein
MCAFPVNEADMPESRTLLVASPATQHASGNMPLGIDGDEALFFFFMEHRV